ncbi:adenylyl transferase [Psychromonas sp. CNPT3]|uniref:HesA/MoeB/ThiF family protein n=1 Tax=Psychromonas sp. CNPT3 TaxID=314282 RepID=UPI00006E9E80|nr:HesA/MoeB/ThiF family protein [Psychromonas sp. CNPT3]AGH82193.1 adenylyl transferase [Psychromonas sp. CNPT3]
MLSDPETLRYSSHLLLKDIGGAGQQKLKSSKVLIIGMGGLGSPAALYLAAAGVGTLVIADFDVIESSNLQRQIAYSSQDIGKHKVLAMKARLEALNPHIRIRSINKAMHEEQLLIELTMIDLVLDCTDNMNARQLINRACVQTKTPLLVGAAIRMEGQLMFFDNQSADSACYHCLFPTTEEQALNCSNSGIVGPVVGIIGTMQALEAIKYIVGLPLALKNKLKLFDAKTLDWQTFAIQKNNQCTVCGGKTCRSE